MFREANGQERIAFKRDPAGGRWARLPSRIAGSTVPPHSTMNRNRWFVTASLTAALATCLSYVASDGLTTFNQSSASAVDKVFADLSKAGSPGCAVGVLRDGRVIYAKGYLLASVELNAPITPESVFDIGSTSKQFTESTSLNCPITAKAPARP